jgi:hypothetical protein
MSGLLDARGCLTDQGVAALAKAQVGKAPTELAAHLAGCARCQDRLLAVERTAVESGKSRPKRPYQNLLLFGVILLLTIVMLGITLSVLSRR